MNSGWNRARRADRANRAGGAEQAGWAGRTDRADRAGRRGRAAKADPWGWASSRTGGRRLIPLFRRQVLGALSLALFSSFQGCSMVTEPGTPGPASTDAPGAERPAREGAPRITPSARPGPVAPPPAPPWGARPPLRLPTQVRGLWVVRTTLVHPDSIRAMVVRADEAGFNTLLVQVRGRGDAYYEGRWEPKPESVLGVGPQFDPLAMVIEEAHARGLGVHAWVNGHLVGGAWGIPSFPNHIVRARPDLLAVPRALAKELFGLDPAVPRYTQALLDYADENSDLVEGLYTSPSDPEVKEHIYSIWMDLVERYDLDGIHFDYIRYPNPNFDYSAGALNRFREWVLPRISPMRQEGLDRAYQADPLAFVDSLPGPWAEFRRAQITDVVERAYYGVKKRKPDVVVSAAVFANADDAFASRFQDWRGWLDRGILDAVAPMAYTPDDPTFLRHIENAVAVAGRDRVWAGIGVYLNTFEGTLEKIRIAEDLGTRGVVLFSYDWAASQAATPGGLTFLERLGAQAFRR